jgi:hypothetical protein
MGTDALNFPYDPWCNTCGKYIPMAIWNENDGECDVCKQWWLENPPFGGPYNDD